MRSKLRLEDEAAVLRANPGELRQVDSFPADRIQAARDLAVAIRQARLGAFRPAGAFYAESHVEEDAHGNRVVNVYAKYLGEE